MTAPEFSDAEMIAWLTTTAGALEKDAQKPNHWSAVWVASCLREAGIARAIAARLTATSGDWQPPPEAERPDRYRCQGWLDGSWEYVVWHADAKCWADDEAWPCEDQPAAFAPLPPTPTQDITDGR